MSTAQETGRQPAAPRPRGWGLRKYVTMTIVSVQDALTYRATATVWMLVEFIPAVVMILVWRAAYGGRQQIEGYSLPDMVTYYLLAGIISASLTSHAEFTMNEEVGSGRLTPQLARPIFYPLGVMCRETGWQVTKILVGLPCFALLAYLFRDQFVMPHFTLGSGLGFAVSMLLAYVILAEIGVCLGTISLWTVESGGMFTLWWSLGSVASGALLPIELLPAPLRAVVAVLPHRWTAYFPIRVALGKVAEGELWLGVLTQLAWAAGLAVVMAAMWRAGTRRYEGWGG